MSQPNPKLLPIALAIALAEQGLRIPSSMGYVYLLDKPESPVSTLIRNSPTADYSALGQHGLGFCPAPDLTDLWQVMPIVIPSEDHRGFLLQLYGRWDGFFRAQYHWESTGCLAQCVGKTPVEAVANLLLEILNRQLISLDQVLDLIQTLNVHES